MEGREGREGGNEGAWVEWRSLGLLF